MKPLLNKKYFNSRRNKMKTLITMMLAFATTLATAAQDKPMTTSYKIDNAASTVGWEAKKVVGGHSGNVSIKDGTITLTGEIITAGEINVDMNSITVSDIPADNEYNAKLVGHLKSPDFFNIEKFPGAKLVIKSSEKTKTGLKIKGDLTFIGKTNAIEFDAVVSNVKGVYTAKSNVVLDRTKWDLKYGSTDFFKGLGDKAINNEFTLAINLSAKK
jgi:polyisoprenoid-binding protein YceI